MKSEKKGKKGKKSFLWVELYNLHIGLPTNDETVIFN